MTCIVVGLDGSSPGEKALAYGKALAKKLGDCELVLAFVIEWTPYSFHTPEELAERHRRREQEIEQARAHVLEPAAKDCAAEGLRVSTEVRHGDPAELLEEIAVERGADQIVVGRTGARGLKQRLFGGVTAKLVTAATVPVTIIP
jgi:nucleotide-binding universal stress UspA family protein